jgi:hypothetical protein
MSGARARGRTNRQLPAGKATELYERRLAKGRAITRGPFPLHDKKSLLGIFCFPPWADLGHTHHIVKPCGEKYSFSCSTHLLSHAYER